MRYQSLLVLSLVVGLGTWPTHAVAQTGCSQREWRLLLEYDPHLMKALEALDWQRYASLQQRLLAQLTRDCLAALGQQQVQRSDDPAAAQPSPGIYDRGADRYSAHEPEGCLPHSCARH